MSFVQTMAQNSSFLGDGVQDYIRRNQLLGKVDLKESLMLQSFAGNNKALDSLLPVWNRGVHNNRDRVFLKDTTTHLRWLPLSVTSTYNSHHPYGWNDGAMIPAAGMETLLSGGFMLEKGRFSLRFKPEMVYTPNTAFETFSTEQYDNYWANFYEVLNKSDIPERFGNKPYFKLFAGQSAIAYRFNNYSIGVSTENLWWGPGRYNALILSNNAPGFAHISLNTNKPIKTGIGLFEAQLIAGRLESSGIIPPDTNRYYNQVKLYQPKTEEWRYMTGITLSWQPKWLKGLFLGFTRVSYLYHSDINGIADIMPLEGVFRSASEKAGRKASLGSLFARWVMPEDHAEVYFEFGRNDKAPSLINLLSDKTYPYAYIAGGQKLFPTKKPDQFIGLGIELTQLSLPSAGLIQQSASWYTNPYVRQGFTNQGQVLGAGIGPGANCQTLDISWVKRYNKVGLKFERLVHNYDFFVKAFIPVQDYTRNWVDISTTLYANLQLKKFLLSGQLGLIRSMNYEWYIFEGLPYFKNGYDVLNIHSNISLSYRL